MSATYNAEHESVYSLEDCQAAIGKRASLTLTGKIVGAGKSALGPYVKFEVDPRFGFPNERIVMDLDPFELEGSA